MKTKSTSNYGQFKKLKGNRPITELKVRRFMKLFASGKMLPWMVVVNEKMEIIDGQHRFEACQRLGIPVEYIIQHGLGLQDAIDGNIVGGIWNKQGHVDSQAELGNLPYIRMKQFQRDFPDFTLGTAELILTQQFGGANEKAEEIIDGKALGRVLAFQHGDMKIVEPEVYNYHASMIQQFKPYFNKYNTGIFVKTMIILFNSDVYNHERMLKKLALQPTALKQCATTRQYKEMLEDIYNYYAKGSERRVSFKYL